MSRFHPALSLLILSNLHTLAFAASPVPDSLVGEWLSGPAYPAGYYNPSTADFRSANSSSERLVIRKDGTYEKTLLRTGATPGYFGARMIACETIDLVWEKGTVTVEKGELVLKPTAGKTRNLATPYQHNNGCTVHAGLEGTFSPQNKTLKYTVAQGTLKLTGQATTTYSSRAKAKQDEEAARAPKIPEKLQGEWYSGTLSPIEYYNPSTGKWADASGTSTILKMYPDGSYTKTGLLVVTTFSCTSKLFVEEEGWITLKANEMEFRPIKSHAVGYSCSPSNKYETRDGVKPSTVKYGLDNPDSGQAVLSLSSQDGTTRYNRPRGTGTAPSTPAQSGTISNNPQPAQPVQQVKPIREDGSGTWKALLSAGNETLELTLTVDEDDRGIMGTVNMNGEYVGWVQGNRQNGTLKIVLNDDDETTFNVTGNFRHNPENPRYPIDSFLGEFQATNQRGEHLGSGVLELSRP